jgi:phosphoribosylamine-glycine ligase
MKTIPILIALNCASCTATYYRTDSATFTRVALGTNTAANQVVAKDGSRVLRIEGYAQTQSEAFAKAAEVLPPLLSPNPR